MPGSDWRSKYAPSPDLELYDTEEDYLKYSDAFVSISWIPKPRTAHIPFDYLDSEGNLKPRPDPFIGPLLDFYRDIPFKENAMVNMVIKPRTANIDTHFWEKPIVFEGALAEEVDRAAGIMVEMWERWGRDEFLRQEGDRCAPSTDSST